MNNGPNDPFIAIMIKALCPFVERIRYVPADNAFKVHLNNGYLNEPPVKQPYLTVPVTEQNHAKAVLDVFKTQVVDHYQTRDPDKAALARKDYELAKERVKRPVNAVDGNLD